MSKIRFIIEEQARLSTSGGREVSEKTFFSHKHSKGKLYY